MKKTFLSFLLLLSTSVNAHQFWPDSYTVLKEPGSSTLVMTHVHTRDDGFFTFTLNGIKLGDRQYVMSGSNTDFPIIVPNGLIKNEEVLLCSLRESADTMQQEVCLRINFQ